jgi:hypothetical protein
MFNEFCALGIDPGPTTGMALLVYRDHLLARAEIYQCNATAAPGLLSYLLSTTRNPGTLPDLRVSCQIERFVRSPKVLKGSGPGVTAKLADELENLAVAQAPTRCAVRVRSAGEVKPWATDERLERAGLLDLVPKQPDGKDACRHALFTACHDAGQADPLSRRARPKLRETRDG